MATSLINFSFTFIHPNTTPLHCEADTIPINQSTASSFTLRAGKTGDGEHKPHQAAQTSR